MARFQLMLTTVLAMSLGGMLALSTQVRDAVGYPAATISHGQNPIVSVGGAFSLGTSDTASEILLTAPAEQDVIITDLHFSGTSSTSACSERWPVTLSSDGSTLAAYSSGIGSSNDYSYPEGFSARLVSGLRVPAGQTLALEVYREAWDGSCSWSRVASFRWAVSGYMAQP